MEPSVHPKHHINMVRRCIPVIPPLRWQRQRDQRFKVVPSYLIPFLDYIEPLRHRTVPCSLTANYLRTYHP